MNNGSITTSILLLTIISLFISNKTEAQQCQYYDLTFKDSLVADDKNNILFNTINIENPTPKTIRLIVHVEVPNDWKTLTKSKLAEGKEVLVTLPPRQVKSIPLNLLKSPKTSAQWEQIKIRTKIPYVTGYCYHYLHLRAKPEPHFDAQAITDDLNFETRPEAIPFKVTIKNTGNIVDTYTIYWQNRNLELNQKYTVQLKPGEDTTCTYILKIPADKWAQMHKEEIILLVNGGDNNSYSHSYKISRPRNVIKEAESAYATIPLSIECGLLNQRDQYYYYFGTRGSFHFGDKNDLSFYYRSKQFGSEIYGIQQNMYLVDYKYHNWHLATGLVQAIQPFFVTNGRGVSAGYRWDKQKEIIATATFKDPNFYYTSNNYAVQYKYPVGKINMMSMLAADFDKPKALNGYVLSNGAQIYNNKKMALQVKADIGIEQKTRDVPGIQKNITGLGGAYTFTYKNASWDFYSLAEAYGKNFPGINKGMSIQSHQLTKNFGDKYAGIFYSSNQMNTTYFRDTLYNTDVLKFNTEKYGITTGIKNEKNLLSLSTGFMRYIGISEYGLNKLYFADVNSTINASDINFTFNSQNAYKNNIDPKGSDVYITSTLASFKYKWAGFLATYTSRPIFGNENNNTVLKSYDETTCVGPFINYDLFKHRLNGYIRYQVAKSVYDQSIRTSVGGSINYNAPHLGLNVICFANIPFTSVSIHGGYKLPISEDKFMNLTVVKQLSVPVLTSRKYYDLKLVLYNDRNNNGIKDKNEEYLNNIQIAVNESQILYTDEDGVAKYSNIEKGKYQLSFGTVKEAGLIPANGLEQTTIVEKNTTLYIGYKKGKKITGHIKIMKDPFSRAILTNDNIKVTAVDTAGKIFTAFSDDSGDFYFYLPAGNYIVSLNPAAFEDSDFRPEQISYPIDLTKPSTANVLFTIKQKARKIRYLHIDN